MLALISTCALVTAQPGVTPPGTPPSGNVLPTGPLPPSGTPPQQLQGPGDPNATPIPAVGDHGSFTYAPSREYDGVSVVFPTQGGEPVLVDTNFLQSAIQSGAPPAQVLQDAQMFENLNSQVTEQYVKTFYPDQSAGTANVPRTELSGSDHNIVVEQDAQAGPYARVTVTDKDGNTIYEGSVSAQIADRVLNNPSADADKKIAELQKAEFQLPEQARANFNGLSTEELLAIVAEKPEVQERAFIKMVNVYENEKQKRAARAEGRADADQAEFAIAQPTPRRERSARPAANRDSGASGEQETGDDAIADSADRRSSDDGLQFPEIIGILLGAVAVGIFVFGFVKSRRG